MVKIELSESNLEIIINAMQQHHKYCHKEFIEGHNDAIALLSTIENERLADLIRALEKHLPYDKV